MARSNTTKRKAPRKAKLAKAVLRTGVAAAAAARPDMQAALARRQRVDFRDPVMRHAAMRAKGIGLCAFLVSLAAFQRGLGVTFHYERASSDPHFSEARMQGGRGEIFSISDGVRSHTFSRTMGDRISGTANAVADDKHLTKSVLNRAGVRTPEGIVVERGQTVLIERFLALHPEKHFVVKPETGSLGEGVEADIPAGSVMAAAARHETGRVIVEEYIHGREVRATVVGGQCVAVSLRLPPTILGNGRETVAQLITELNASARSDPYWDGLTDEDMIRPYLSLQGYNLDGVVPAGTTVRLSNTSYGVQHEDVTDRIGPRVKAIAVKAAQAIGLSLCGLDVIVTPDGEPVVLEVNQRSYIGMHSFPCSGPGQGNVVAEAIIDDYFPDTISNRTHPGLVFDFGAVRTAMQSMQIGTVSLPVIGADWRVMRFVEKGITARTLVKIYEAAARVAGVYLVSAPRVEGGFDLCLTYAPTNLRRMLQVLPPQFRKSLATRAQEIGM